MYTMLKLDRGVITDKAILGWNHLGLTIISLKLLKIPKGSFSAFRFPDFHRFSSVQVKKCFQTYEQLGLVKITIVFRQYRLKSA